MRKRLYILIACACVALCATATDYFFRPVNLAEGLPQMSVQSIYQDEEGLMWFATRQGLARYDGTTMRVLNPDPKDSCSLFSPVVEQVCGDKQGRIYIRTTGINCYDLHTATLSRIVSPADRPQTMLPIDNGLLLSVRNHICRYTPATGMTDTLCAVPDSCGRVCALTLSHGRLWVGTERGHLLCFARMEGAEEKESNWQTAVASVHYDLGSQVAEIYEDAAHTLWIGTWANGLYALSTTGLKHYGTDTGLLSDFVRAVYQDGAHQLWIGTDVGLQCVTTGECYLQGQSVWALYGDRVENLWVGTYFDGVSYFNPSIDFYRRISLPLEPFPVISSILELPDGSFCLMTEGSGLYIVSAAGEVLHTWETPNIKSYHFDTAHNRLYLGTHLGGLYCLDLQTLRMTHYTLPAKQYGSHIVRAIVAMGDTLLLGTHNGVFTFDTERASFSILSDTLTQVMRKVVAMERDGETLYLGGEKLLAYDLRTQAVRTIPLPCTSIEKLLFGPQHRLWIGTDGSGLLVYTPAEEQTAVLSHEQGGLQNNYIRNLIQTRAGNVLAVTTHGFSMIDPATLHISNYTPGPYMPLSSLYNGGVCATRSGEIWLAGMNGMVAFREENLHHIVAQPHILLTSLYINSVEQTCAANDRRSVLSRPINYTDTITLSYYQKNLTLDYVAATDFLFTDNFTLRYCIENDRNEGLWQTLTDQAGTLRLMNLPIGANRLRLQVLDEALGKVLSERVLTLVVRAPWYRTTTAYIIYVALAACLVAGGVYLEERRVKKVLRKQASDQYAHLREEIEHYLTEHLTDSELDINQLCRQIGVGRTRLFMVFREIYDTTPQQLIAERRLQTAADWLLNKPNLNISEIAYDLGFQSPKYFARCFKERFGQTPTQYRRQHND